MIILNAMEEAVGDEVAEVASADGLPLQSKEVADFTLKPGGSSRVLQSNEMVTPGEDDYDENTNNIFSDRIGSSERASGRPHYMDDDTGVMVEELTVENYDGGKLGKKQMKKQWQHLYQLGGGSGISEHKEKGRGDWEDGGEAFFSAFIDKGTQHLLSNEDKGTMSNASGGIRTKVLSKSGFSEYFIKSSLRGKGMMHKFPPSRNESRGQAGPTSATVVNPPGCVSETQTNPKGPNAFNDGISLREWLDGGQNRAKKDESLHMFRQVLHIVDSAHSEGVTLQDLRPSSIKLSASYNVVYVGSSVDSGIKENDSFQDVHQSSHYRNEKRPVHPSGIPLASMKKQKLSDFNQSWPQSPSLEEKWYCSPERRCTFASNVYCLGVLLFELLGSFDSETSRAAAMIDLHHRILPPAFLSEYPKEAGFCLWLLHPQPSSRPKIRQILESEFIKGIQDLSGGELLPLPSIDEEDGESELLLYFLGLVNEQKHKDASKLAEQIQFIEADIEEVKKRQPKKSLIQSLDSSTISGSDEIRLTSNIKQLENPYFSMRSNIQVSDSDVITHRNRELLKSRESYSKDRLGSFFDGLCKYARYSKFKVQGILRNGDFNNSSANVISSLSFDRDEDYLASGGVSKKIKIFEFESLFNDSVDIHYPVIEMTNETKLTCICWNNYVRNYLASTDYSGAVKLWDATSGQGFSRLAEHSERAWSVDFSHADPMKLVSGGDDRMVKLWSINEKNSLYTIRNSANVCCVQFSAESSHMLAFSSSDYKTYCYDIRNTSIPWCILAGHVKAVSYAKFLDAATLVTASTDNTLKIWDLNKTSPHSLSRDACILTLRGHTNEKNFVGLSVADGYIACGSETNEVFAYYKSLPMPITSHKFGSIDPISGKETEDDNGQFVSIVCWRQKSNMVVAANSTGCIKLLQMV